MAMTPRPGTVSPITVCMRPAVRNPREADEQLRHYVTEIAKGQSYAPFGFMTNGLQTWFWKVGVANPRVVAGFFSPQDLQRLLFLRQNARPLPEIISS